MNLSDWMRMSVSAFKQKAEIRETYNCLGLIFFQMFYHVLSCLIHVHSQSETAVWAGWHFSSKNIAKRRDTYLDVQK